MLDAKSKYRLIGAGLLIASAAVLLPLVLDGERPDTLDVQIVVPDKPRLPEVVIAPVQPLTEPDTQKSDNEVVDVPEASEIELIPAPQKAISTTESLDTSVEASSADVKEKVSDPVKTEARQSTAPIAERWTLQVATFGKRDNATRTLKKLQDAGYPAYVVTTNSLYKVFVGPELKRSASDKAKEDIKKEFLLNGIVVKYAPNS
ncbi:SPOR domain-containing protein [Marinomonas piezotolerans]|uniref:SPOR domain-containing protein n=1 Tax=Marinomonas piezotolerans TaxID=2213058 RepID=A0A370UEB5_9GAMM|nr:SPOR domain-containing protein [Marinomonas piezotolerans]RDL46130.1 SPOR domain-containing protein [Marinomonas piezotolerans]